MKGSVTSVWIFTSLAAALALLVCPVLGGGLDVHNLLLQKDPDWAIYRELRLPRAILACLTGAALATAGALFQVLLRDPLAAPSVLGISASASLGAVLVISLGTYAATAYPVLCVAALIGAILVALHSRGIFSALSLLLTGIAINGICSAMVLLLHSMAGLTRSFQITQWLLGGIDSASFGQLGVLTAVVLPLCAWIFWRSRDWNLLSYGEIWAAGRGVDTKKRSLSGFVAGAILVGTVTSATGPISFVELMAPHILRRILGPDQRLILAASPGFGAAFLLICDTMSRSVLAPTDFSLAAVAEKRALTFGL
jgi:iron complex transport system permease protein